MRHRWRNRLEARCSEHCSAASQVLLYRAVSEWFSVGLREPKVSGSNPDGRALGRPLAPTRNEVLNRRTVSCSVDDLTPPAWRIEVHVHWAVDRLSSGRAVVADEDEHLDASVVLFEDDFVHGLVGVQDHAQLESSRFPLTASKARAGSEQGKQQAVVGGWDGRIVRR
jgi:hypothetical protein